MAASHVRWSQRIHTKVCEVFLMATFLRRTCQQCCRLILICFRSRTTAHLLHHSFHRPMAGAGHSKSPMAFSFTILWCSDSVFLRRHGRFLFYSQMRSAHQNPVAPVRLMTLEMVFQTWHLGTRAPRHSPHLVRPSPRRHCFSDFAARQWCSDAHHGSALTVSTERSYSRICIETRVLRCTRRLQIDRVANEILVYVLQRDASANVSDTFETV